jgi:CheY-like chemotaxis protein
MAMTKTIPSEPIHDDLSAIEQCTLRSAAIVRQLLAFARKQTVAPEVLDLNDTVTGMLSMLQRLIGEEVAFSWIPAAELWHVKIDPTQVDQLLANLCANARDAIAGVGKITIESGNKTFDQAFCAAHPGFVPGEYAMLAVSDNGCGMEKHIVDNIFEPFFTTKEIGKGTGLGLATVYGIIKQNDGFISVESEPGKGSTFRLYLPRFSGDSAVRSIATTPEMPRGRGENILLVEDEQSVLNVARTMLEGLGYEVLTAGTPGEALRLAKEHAGRIRLLFTDVVMPEMDGRTLAKLVGEINPASKCLFVSGYAPDIIARHGVLDENMFFLPKPFKLKDLALKVRAAMDQA